MKGAYWDSEIKLAQVQGHADYPVFTRKAATDVSWLACARRMLECRDAIYPAFATHNAHSLAFVLECAGDGEFEMQRLHGMGEALYHDATYPVRVYAPVGTHEDLLAYLVRRLLENGANTSFVHRLVDPSVPEEAIVADPVARLRALGASRNPRIPLPRDLYPDADQFRRRRSRRSRDGAGAARRDPPPRRPREHRSARDPQPCRSPHGGRRDRRCGPAEIDAELDLLARGWRAWDMAGGAHRAAVLERAADLIEASRDELLFLLAREGGKTLADGIAEIREAADYCRWYALHARRGLRRAARAARTDRRAQHLGARRTRRVRRHLAVELSAGDLHRPGRRRARRRQCGGCQTGRTDAAGRRPRRRRCCSTPVCRARRWHCCRATGRSARRW